MSDTVVINIVDDIPCPGCGSFWGHPDKTLNFPNRPKVGDDDGTWWWRCYNPRCQVGYYNPTTGDIEHKEVEV